MLLFRYQFNSILKYFPPKWRQDPHTKSSQTTQYHAFVLLAWFKKKKSIVQKHFPYGLIPQGCGFGSGATLWDHALHITFILKPRQLRLFPQQPHFQQLNTVIGAGHDSGRWETKKNPTRQTTQFFIFQNKCSVYSGARNEHERHLWRAFPWKYVTPLLVKMQFRQQAGA